MFNSELDMLEVRLLELYDFVNYFVIGEAPVHSAPHNIHSKYMHCIEGWCSSGVLHQTPQVRGRWTINCCSVVKLLLYCLSLNVQEHPSLTDPIRFHDGSVI